jgi:hypothetical protein
LLSFETYDKWLVPLKTNYKGLSFFVRIKKAWNNIPKLKIIYEIITNSTISKLTSNIITTAIGGLLILIIWAVYRNRLIELWVNNF